MVKMFVILLIAFSACSLANGENLCPRDKVVYPCFCFLEEEEDNRPVLLCDNIRNIKRIRRALDAVKGKDIALSFQRTDFDEIPSNYFKGHVSSEINFEECFVSSYGEVPFSGMEDSLRRLGIFDSFYEPNMKTKSIKLGHLRKLQSFVFQDNDVKRMGNEWFANGPATLTQVNVEKNRIEELGDKLFAPLINLEQVWIGDNQLKQLSRSMFPNPAQRLAVLEMGLLDLRSLPEDLFDAMPALRVINLTANKLLTLPQNTWKPVWNQLEEVHVDYNRALVCDKQLRWIYEGKLPKTFHGTCFGNNALAGKKLADLTLSDFD